MNNWTPTPDSSNLSGFGYDPTSHTLTVEFNNGTSYGYYDVPEHIYEGMLTAQSRGSYLAKMVKKTYRYNRL